MKKTVAGGNPCYRFSDTIMMEVVEAGKINCTATKDLPRFGCEHVMMGYYLEFVFPEKQIRYIAVAENEDTERGISDFVPFKNLFNEEFS